MVVCYPAAQLKRSTAMKLFGEVTETASVPPINPSHIGAEYHHDSLYKYQSCV